MIRYAGQKVKVSGYGRTASWKKNTGTVIKKMENNTFEVQWDGTSFGDQMDAKELIWLKNTTKNSTTKIH